MLAFTQDNFSSHKDNHSRILCTKVENNPSGLTLTLTLLLFFPVNASAICPLQNPSVKTLNYPVILLWISKEVQSNLQPEICAVGR